MDNIQTITGYLGDQNEEIEEEDLIDIEEEIDSIEDDKDYFKLAKIAIKLGKPQILNYLIKIFKFNVKEIDDLCKEIEKYHDSQVHDSDDSDDTETENIHDIVGDYAKVVKNWCKPGRKGVR